MGCACGNSSARSAQGAQRLSAQQGGGAYEYEVTYAGGGTQRFPTESEAIAALRHGGGGYKQVPRNR